MRYFVKLLSKTVPIAFLIMLLLVAVSPAADPTTPGELTSHATLHSIGIEWQIVGDDDHDAQCLVQYRIQGTSTWNTFLPLYRVDDNGANTLAGSILFLKPATTYEVKLSLSDPDGGSQSRTEMIATRSRPRMPLGGRKFHVVPGSGGGDGTRETPFQGVAAAQSVAAAGDIFLLHAGDYSGEIEFTVSGAPGAYIAWKGAGDGAAVIDRIRVNADHIWLENLTVTNPDYGLLTYDAPEDVVVKNNIFLNCHYAIYLNHGGSNWTIVDNEIVGDQIPGACSDSACWSGEGIELGHTSGHVVAYNTISQVADGISYPHENCDIYGNDIFDTSDDGIELDYGYANVRCWRNRISNPKNNGISFQPVNGAPWYVLRNQVAAPLENAIKFRGADRALIAHNTLLGWSGVEASGSEYLSRVQSNNNLWISVQDRYVWESNSDDGFVPFWGLNLDYDGFDWGENDYAIKWKGVRYETLEDFRAGTGLEENGIRVDKDSCFETLTVVQPPGSMPAQYLTLVSGCNAENAGVVLPGINEDYTGNGPDLGAYESGAMLPHYGMRIVDMDGDGDVDGADLSALAQTTTGLMELTAAFTNQFGT
jgi:hypothetical protein